MQVMHHMHIEAVVSSGLKTAMDGSAWVVGQDSGGSGVVTAAKKWPWTIPPGLQGQYTPSPLELTTSHILEYTYEEFLAGILSFIN